MNADELKSIAAKYFLAKKYAVHFEIGLSGGRYRADLLAVNMRSELIICETKSSVQDFKSDKKWTTYQQYCTQFYFVFAVDVYKKVRDLIPKGTGVMVINPRTGNLKIFSPAKKHQVDPVVRLNVITRMAFRSADKNRHKHKSKVTTHKVIAECVLAEVNQPISGAVKARIIANLKRFI